MNTGTLTQRAVQDQRDRLQADQYEKQYSLLQILGIWALVTIPMALLGWVVAPAVIANSRLIPGITYWLLMIAGMAWQFVVSMAIMYRELGTLRWSLIRRRTWLQIPRDPKTGEPNPKMFWWVLPAIFCSGWAGPRRISGGARPLVISFAASYPLSGFQPIGKLQSQRSMVAPRYYAGQLSL
jgi:hypothetical protein